MRRITCSGWPRRLRRGHPRRVVARGMCDRRLAGDDRAHDCLAADVATAAVPSRTPTPSSPKAFELERIDRSFPSVIALESTGAQLYWASEASIWRFSPGADDAEKVYEAPAEGAVVWDLAAVDGAYVFSERLANPAGSWRVQYVAGDAPAVELDRGIAERGAPPTLAIDERRIAWAGFDESTGTPRSFLRVVERASPAAPTTILDLDIDAGLLWYPQLDRDALWYSDHRARLRGDRGGRRVPHRDHRRRQSFGRAGPVQGLERIFEPAVSTDYVVWKAVEPELSALTWGDLHALDRRSNERLVIAEQANHPSSRVAVRRLRGDHPSAGSCSTTWRRGPWSRSLIRCTAPTGRSGLPAVSGNLLGYSVSVEGIQHGVLECPSRLTADRTAA